MRERDWNNLVLLLEPSSIPNVSYTDEPRIHTSQQTSSEIQKARKRVRRLFETTLGFYWVEHFTLFTFKMSSFLAIAVWIRMSKNQPSISIRL